MRCRAVTLSLAIVLSLLTPRLAASQPSAAETRAEFEAVCARLTADSPFFGEAVVDRYRGQLATAGLSAQDAAPLRLRLAIELARLDRLPEALATLEEVQVDDPDILDSRLLIEAIVRLLLAEEQNCIEQQSAESCILPIQPSAVHRRPELSRAAGDLYLDYLERHPDNLQIRWLLNLSRMLAGDFPAGVPEAYRLPPGALESGSETPRWRNIAATLGVDAFDLAGGAVIDDFDGDGLLDLIASSWDPCEPLKAFRNDGAGGFADVTGEWGLDGQLGGLNLNQADFDNDGRLDLLILRGAWLGADGKIRNSLLRNDLARPTGRFVDVTVAAGLAYPSYPSQAASWADYDADGDLDLYVGNEAREATLMAAGRTGEAYPSQLFRNNDNGTFTDVARAAGVANRRFTKGVAWGDYDNDGDPDLYVSTFEDNRLYRNNSDGTFTDVAPELGATAPRQASFATWFFDFDNDGDLDIFVADYGASIDDIAASAFGLGTIANHPLIHRNDSGRFTTLGPEIGFERPLLPMGANFGDLDNDGWLDVYLGTGVPNFEALMPNIMYRNVAGERFEDITFAGGFGHLQKGHGVAFGDLDNDGDQDLFEQLGGAYPYDRYSNALYANPGTDNAWIVLRLVGRRANRFAVGGRVEIQVEGDEGTRTIHSLVGSGGSFGGSSLQQEVGLGRAHHIKSLTILWPGSNTTEVFTDVEINRFYQATEGGSSLEALTPAAFVLPASPQPASPHRRHSQ